MLFWLYQWGINDYPELRIFGYLTVRAALAIAIALIFGVIVGPAFIRWLVRRKIGQQIRGDGIPELYERHKGKAETPTMGGLLILAAFLLAAVGFGGIGALDDWKKIAGKNYKGISAKGKLLAQGILAFAIAVWIYNLPDETFQFRTSEDASIQIAAHSVTTRAPAALHRA